MSYYRYELGNVGSKILTEEEATAIRIAKSISFAIMGSIDCDAASSGYRSSRDELRSRMESTFRSLARSEAGVTVSLEWDAKDTLFVALTQGERWTVQQTLYLQWRGNEMFQMLIKGGANLTNGADEDCLAWLESMAALILPQGNDQ